VTEPQPSVRLPGNLAPLGYRNYALYWFGLASSNAGRWAEQTGSVWLVYLLTNSPVLLGLLGISKALPTLLIGPLAGVVADRIDQRRLLFATQGLSLIASLILGLLVLTGQVQLWQIYLEVFLTSVISAFDVSSRQALFPRLIPRRELPSGVTLTSLAGRASAVVGPAIGGLAIAALGVASPYLINAATFLVLMGALVAMRNVAPQAAGRDTSFVTELREGLGYIRRTKVLSGLLRLEIVFGAFQANPVIIAIIGREVLHVGPEGLGGLLSAPALGALAGLGCLLIFGHTQRPGRFVVICQWIYSAALVAFALSTQYLLSFVLLAATGFLDILETVTRLSIAQLAAPGRMRGRVMANMRTVTGGVGPMAQTQSGILADAIGGPAALVVAALALATSATTTVWTNRPLWRFTVDEVRAEPDEVPAEPEIRDREELVSTELAESGGP
jgi:MFS family permease